MVRLWPTRIRKSRSRSLRGRSPPFSREPTLGRARHAHDLLNRAMQWLVSIGARSARNSRMPLKTIRKDASDRAGANMPDYADATARLDWATFRTWLDYLPNG